MAKDSKKYTQYTTKALSKKREKRNSLHCSLVESFLYSSLTVPQSLTRTILFRPSPFFFFRLASNAFPDIGSVGRIEKKKPKKRITRSLGVRGTGTPGRRQKLTFTYLD